ncbi:MAG: hypothetical protein HOO90_02555 [Methylotenera sp.]|uniref:hypothetical protein n=1 Tax=Methylotenera sp. TaxID=2051956 RepID=UPI0017E47656|nr:hypothetical protein [Methylotenera sp.]NOU24399.1 hypothetical protein [Methylotenera sp.]
MTLFTTAPFAIFLDITMIIYTLWVLSLSDKNGKLPIGIGIGMLTWLGLLHLGLSTKSLFPENISEIAFLLIIFVAVGVVGALLLLVTPIRDRLLSLSQKQLLLLQGVRVFFGANFLMQASLGGLPQTFGILDGWTHIGAGFFGLIAGFTLATDVDGERRAWFANIFGMVDILVVASTLALVLLPTITPFHPMMYAVFLPAPLWLWFHLVSIWKLMQSRNVNTQKALA